MAHETPSSLSAPPASLLLVLGVLLAGCSGGGGGGVDDAATPTPTEVLPGVEVLAGQALANVSYAWPTARFVAEVSDAIPAQGYSGCIGPVCQPDYSLDLSDDLAPDTPYRLTVNLTWDTSNEPGGAVGSLWLYVDVGEESVFVYNETIRPGFWSITHVFTRSEGSPIMAHVSRNAPDAAAETPFTLRMEAEALTNELGFGFPLGLEVPGSATTLVVAATQPFGRLRMWGPDDQYLGETALDEAVTEVPLAGAGMHILQFIAVAPGVRLATVQDAGAAAPEIRLLPVVRTFDEPHDVAPGATVDWESEVPTVPLNAGLYVGNLDGGFVAIPASGSLESPAGPVAAFDDMTCLYCNDGSVTGGVYLRFGGGYGAPNVVAGTYSGHFESALSQNVQVGTYTFGWAR
ncbi:MAG TPA: hypothetical protein VI796_02270 [Candidatus Thermoplasmatota archaeon]|nr:hypothetical protein [Candidatus Thermoplasmatota archaeon]